MEGMAEKESPLMKGDEEGGVRGAEEGRKKWDERVTASSFLQRNDLLRDHP